MDGGFEKQTEGFTKPSGMEKTPDTGGFGGYSQKVPPNCCCFLQQKRGEEFAKKPSGPSC